MHSCPVYPGKAQKGGETGWVFNNTNWFAASICFPADYNEVAGREPVLFPAMIFRLCGKIDYL